MVREEEVNGNNYNGNYGYNNDANDSNNQLFCFLTDTNYLKQPQNRFLIGIFLKTNCEN